MGFQDIWWLCESDASILASHLPFVNAIALPAEALCRSEGVAMSLAFVHPGDRSRNIPPLCPVALIAMREANLFGKKVARAKACKVALTGRPGSVDGSKPVTPVPAAGWPELRAALVSGSVIRKLVAVLRYLIDAWWYRVVYPRAWDTINRKGGVAVEFPDGAVGGVAGDACSAGDDDACVRYVEAGLETAGYAPDDCGVWRPVRRVNS